MPTFCRHNRFLAKCPICSGDAVEVVTSATPGAARAAGGTASAPRKRSGSSTSTSRGGGGGMRVHHVAREQEDGFRSPLIPGVKASAAAERLAEEIAFAAGRLELLADDPPGLYGAVAREDDREEALWLAFLIAYLGPLEGEDPFGAVAAVRTSWASGELPALEGVATGPRTAHDAARGTDTLAAYRAWAERAGSQEAAFAGEAAWTPQRRFARAFERMALPGLHRDARFDLLVTLGQLGLHELDAPALQLGGADDTTVAAKRVFGIADTMLLERRAADLGEAGEVPLAALDLGLWNWNRPARPAALPGGAPTRDRATLGTPAIEPDADAYARVAAALGL